MTDQAFLLQEGDSERRWLGETSTDFLASGDHTGGAFALVDERAMQGESVPLHRHPDDMEPFYVLEGEVSFFLDGNVPGRARSSTSPRARSTDSASNPRAPGTSSSPRPGTASSIARSRCPRSRAA